MAYLFIDTRLPGEAAAYWSDGTREEALFEKGRAADLLGAVQARLPELRSELEGVAVVAGPGRFSALRVGVLYAHVLARWFRVPLFEAEPADAVGAVSRADFIRAVARGEHPAQAYVAPRYDREPNITSPRL